MRWIEMCERDGETELSWRLNNNWLTVIYTSSWHCSIAALCIYTYILYIDHSAIQCSLRLNMCFLWGGREMEAEGDGHITGAPPSIVWHRKCSTSQLQRKKKSSRKGGSIKTQQFADFLCNPKRGARKR